MQLIFLPLKWCRFIYFMEALKNVLRGLRGVFWVFSIFFYFWGEFYGLLTWKMKIYPFTLKDNMVTF